MEERGHGVNSLLTLLESVSDAVVITDTKGHVIRMNPPAELITGISMTEAVGAPLSSFVRIVSGENRMVHKLPTVAALRKDPNMRRFDSVLINRNGHETAVVTSILPAMEDHSVIGGIIIVFSDRLRAHKDEDSLIERQKVQAIGLFASNISTSLNNWLSVITGHASHIMESVIPSSRTFDDALNILNTARQASGLNQRLMSIARAARTDAPSTVQRVSLLDVVSSAISLVDGSFRERGIQFRIDDIEPDCYVKVEADSMLECLASLFLNSADAMPKGGIIDISIGRRMSKDPGFLVLRVHDNGIGMTSQVRQRIFEPFFSTKNPGVAMGLGLSMVKASVTKWGGSVRVRSQPSRGAIFSFILPRAVEIPFAPPLPPAEAPTQRRAVLVTDVNARMLIEASEILTGAGFDVLAAPSADRALEIFGERAADIGVSIVDLVMPDKDGKTIIDAIMALDPNAPLIVTSGFSRDYARSRLPKGPWLFVQKPFEKEQLLLTVKRAIENNIRSIAATAATP